MRLKNLNKLVFKMIETSETSKAEFASRLNMSLPAFSYKYKNGNLEWNEIKKLKIPLTRSDFRTALRKDFKDVL